ncbi:hypothetical protein FOXG_20546 [Fusarium oxysporum f. sp. lycopersici 4287]|uniref:Uncharacterized protein n=2 Tax=Fusarium oxysporum TaxID=5507 RepID=A0A0J9WR05_FUSO4|nr:hypothetical protein FOXG_20546 [Fusarium oxysporum f. sp. lycopersici 4287]EXK30120.1 hypothetical protein FOMG_13771 [Fusarium oxysporum f. sp. melonis 26406]KNB11692.1 hypothetical protein FOXG_20546 [Fusarium oxysporum f. sp. lycopersici 4287]
MIILPLALYLRYSMLAGTGKCCILGTLKDEGCVGRQHKMKESDREI